MANSILRLTDTGNREANGLRILGLDLYVDGRITESWLVNSGQADAQELLTYLDPQSYSGDYRPIPEDVYNVGRLAFQGGKFDWADSWGAGLGDFWAPIDRAKGVTKRGSFGFHWDENRATAPGSAGCVVFPTKAAVEDFVKAMRKYDPAQLVVDWGLGTVPGAPATKQTQSAAPQKTASAPKESPKGTSAAPQAIFITPYINDNGAVVDFAARVEPGQYRIYTTTDGRLKLIKKQ